MAAALDTDPDSDCDTESSSGHMNRFPPFGRDFRFMSPFGLDRPAVHLRNLRNLRMDRDVNPSCNVTHQAQLEPSAEWGCWLSCAWLPLGERRTASQSWGHRDGS